MIIADAQSARRKRISAWHSQRRAKITHCSMNGVLMIAIWHKLLKLPVYTSFLYVKIFPFIQYSLFYILKLFNFYYIYIYLHQRYENETTIFCTKFHGMDAFKYEYFFITYIQIYFLLVFMTMRCEYAKLYTV